MDQLLLKPLAAIVSISEFLCKNKIKAIKKTFLTFFCRQCIKKWLQLKNVCPLCHRKVFKVLWFFDFFSDFFSKIKILDLKKKLIFLLGQKFVRGWESGCRSRCEWQWGVECWRFFRRFTLIVRKKWKIFPRRWKKVLSQICPNSKSVHRLYMKPVMRKLLSVIYLCNSIIIL